MSMPNNFAPSGFGLPAPGLAIRRGGQNIKPLSFDSNRLPTDKETVPTPRTARGHLLAGLRTAPKSATAATFPASSTTTGGQAPMFAKNNMTSGAYGPAQSNAYNAPKTALPRFAGQQQQQQYGSMMGISQQFTPDQVLAPPEIRIDEHSQDHMDPQVYAHILNTNAYLNQRQQHLQQQLLNLHAAAQQLQGLNMNAASAQQLQAQQLQAQQLQAQQIALYQQQQLHNMQHQLASSAAAQPNIYAYVDPATGQQTYYVDQSSAHLVSPFAMEQSSYAGIQQMSQIGGTPRVQVSPPPENHSGFRSNSPPKRYESPGEVTPLPPPSANAFRRGHKKASSLAVNSSLGFPSHDMPKSAGPRTAGFPLTPLTGGYGPGQARAGEHPIRQPRGPPSFDELKAKPTAKHEGSKNFAARTRRSAVGNLVRAGLERRKGTASSSGSMSPVSESAEESATPITDNDSDSGHSGSGSLSGDVDCSVAGTRTSGTGGWGAIGSDRPSSRQKARKSVDSISSATSGCDSDTNTNSFANVFKHGAHRPTKGAEPADGQRKAPMLVLTSAEKRKGNTVA